MAAMDAAYEVGVLTFEGKDRAEATMDVLRQAAGNRSDVDVMVEQSPLIELSIPGYTPAAAPAA